MRHASVGVVTILTKERSSKGLMATMLVLQRRRTAQDLFTIYAIQQWVRDVFKTTTWSAPVQRETLCSLTLRFVAEDLDLPATLPDLSVFDDNRDVVGVSPAQDGDFAQRFSLAHDIVHLLKHRRHLTGTTSAHDHLYHGWMEVEANAGATEMLLPYAWFMDRAQQYVGNPLHTIADLELFLTGAATRRWAAEAEVSLPVLGYHLWDLGWVGAPIANPAFA